MLATNEIAHIPEQLGAADDSVRIDGVYASPRGDPAVSTFRSLSLLSLMFLGY
jgi:hypothetical protein